jgi:hypothetical protein
VRLVSALAARQQLVRRREHSDPGPWQTIGLHEQVHARRPEHHNLPFSSWTSVRHLLPMFLAADADGCDPEMRSVSPGGLDRASRASDRDRDARFESQALRAGGAEERRVGGTEAFARRSRRGVETTNRERRRGSSARAHGIESFRKLHWKKPETIASPVTREVRAPARRKARCRRGST